MSSDEHERPRRADAQANRDAVLRAATQLYGEHGPDVSYEDIARAAGVGRATVYRHFPTRDALLLAMLEQVVRRLEAIAAELPDGPDAFWLLLQEAVAVQVDNLPLVQLLPPHPQLPKGIRGLRRRIHDLYRGPLAAAQAAGLVGDDLTPSDARMLVSMVSAVVRPGTSAADRRRALALASRALAPGRPD